MPMAGMMWFPSHFKYVCSRMTTSLILEKVVNHRAIEIRTRKWANA
jgi:hypothetical protein